MPPPAEQHSSLLASSMLALLVRQGCWHGWATAGSTSTVLAASCHQLALYKTCVKLSMSSSLYH